MEDNVKDSLDELNRAMNQSFGSGLYFGAVLGALMGIACTVAGRKVSDLVVQRYKAKGEADR